MLEQENTLRVLKGDDPLVTSRWCSFGFHTWTKWNNEKIVKTYKDTYVIQRKECAHCNDFTERKKYLKL